MEITKELAHDIILDRYENPQYKLDNKDDQNSLKREALAGKKLIAKGYVKGHNDSPSCIDNIDGYVLVKNGVIKDVRFAGNACTICKSSTDIMAQNLIGKKVKDAKVFLKNYFNMILKEKYDEETLGYLIVYKDVNKQANRVKCALTGVQALEKAIINYEEK